MQDKSFLAQSVLGFHRMAYSEWGQTTEKPPVICVHGLTRNRHDFDRLAEAVQNDRRVLCPDIVGRGDSDWLSDPALYGYPQYISDMVALIARADAASIDWVGTSMGGIIGMLIAAMQKSPIRRLVLNDVGPFIPLAALKRIGDYVGKQPVFSSREALQNYMRVAYAPFGITQDKDWQDVFAHSERVLPNGQFSLAYDPTIAQGFKAVDKDVDLWDFYDRIQCPVLVLRGALSDVLSRETAAEMTRRGTHAQFIEFANVGHAPALIDLEQINSIRSFLGE